MDKIYVITSSFPYGTGEKSFIIPELYELVKEFDVTILSCAGFPDRSKSDLPDDLKESVDVLLLNDSLSVGRRLKYLILSVFSLLFWKEIFFIKMNRRKLSKNFYFTLSFFARALNITDQLINVVKFGGDSIIYTYWYNHTTLGALLAGAGHSKVITRTHGIDLYQERTPGSWQPFKKYMTNKLDRIYFACDYGRRYYIDTYSVPPNMIVKLQLARLGVSKKAQRNIKNSHLNFTLISCSNVIPLKRVELIIEALSLCEDLQINWVHFGDGENMQYVNKFAETKLKGMDNISYRLQGYIENEKLLEFYTRKQVDCFISTSMTEGGCPVSIQEALSYGIPIIGTKAGGIQECIANNGVLLPTDPSPDEIAFAIRKIYMASSEEADKMRNKSYYLWKERFDSEKNHSLFVQSLKQIV